MGELSWRSIGASGRVVLGQPGERNEAWMAWRLSTSVLSMSCLEEGLGSWQVGFVVVGEDVVDKA
jgi:hypothetical protein